MMLVVVTTLNGILGQLALVIWKSLLFMGFSSHVLGVSFYYFSMVHVCVCVPVRIDVMLFLAMVYIVYKRKDNLTAFAC